ncbi:phytanoyl-CoA dioxygenase family protein [Sphingomicrobium sp. XHP0235]|uniref:phytanoyl-CoA dioxygenase family protein n=1 Tax=Sphingomicrobium aquimarinum TaxID=3133971 RepID=UPI0031FEA2E8
MTTDFERLGYLHLAGAMSCDELSFGKNLFERLAGRPGLRLHNRKEAGPLLAEQSSLVRAASRLLQGTARPVRITLFDKELQTNWGVGWHQDRTVALAKRTDAIGFGPWTVKDGIPHAEPPVALLQEMITLRAHLDPVDRDNGALEVLPGSHREGRILKSKLEARANQADDVYRCFAAAGDLWAYRTLIVHRSAPSVTHRRRRVLQIDFAIGHPGEGLEWAVN